MVGWWLVGWWLVVVVVGGGGGGWWWWLVGWWLVGWWLVVVGGLVVVFTSDLKRSKDTERNKVANFKKSSEGGGFRTPSFMRLHLRTFFCAPL